MSESLVVVPLRPAMRAVLERAAHNVEQAQRAQSDLLAGAVLNASDVDLSRVQSWALTADGVTLTLTDPPPE